MLDAHLALAAGMRLAADPAEGDALRDRLSARLAQGDREGMGLVGLGTP